MNKKIGASKKKSKKLVLLVEDEPSLQEAIKMRLKEDGVKVFPFSNGKEALEFIKKDSDKIDLVWLDILLPGMNGLELLSAIRNDLKLKDLPVVIVSVSASKEKLKKASDLNVLEFIVKSEGSLGSIIDRVKKYL